MLLRICILITILAPMPALAQALAPAKTLEERTVTQDDLAAKERQLAALRASLRQKAKEAFYSSGSLTQEEARVIEARFSRDNFQQIVECRVLEIEVAEWRSQLSNSPSLESEIELLERQADSRETQEQTAEDQLLQDVYNSEAKALLQAEDSVSRMEPQAK